MKKEKIFSAFKSFGKSISKHSPEILTGIGIAGSITTTVLAIKATPKAVRLVDQKKEELKTEKLPSGEIVKTVWKCYIPTAISCAASTTCLIAGLTVGAKRNAAIAAAYKLSETALTNYKESVVETIGSEKEKDVRSKVAEKSVASNPVKKSDIIITEKGNTLCYDPLSGRYFKSDIDKIRKAENAINKSILSDAFGSGASLNDFYDELGLPNINVGDSLGWNIETTGILELDFSSQIAGEDSEYEGTPCIVLDYINPPKYDYA